MNNTNMAETRDSRGGGYEGVFRDVVLGSVAQTDRRFGGALG